MFLAGRGLLVLLLLAWGGAAFARVDLGSGGNEVPDAAFSLQTTFDPQATDNAQAFPETETKANSGQQIPAWLQIILTMGIAILIYYVILAIVRRRINSTEEIIHVKNREGDSGYSVEQPSGPVAVPGRQPQEYRVPPQDPSGGLGRPRTAKKGSSWGLVVLFIVILNVIRQCIQSD